MDNDVVREATPKKVVPAGKEEYWRNRRAVFSDGGSAEFGGRAAAEFVE